MNINDLTIGQAREIAALVANAPVPSSASHDPLFRVGDNVIVRSRDAGVLFGKFQGNDGSTVKLTDAVQLWKWHAAKGITLLDVAEYGVKKTECKFSSAKGTVAVLNACAVISVTDEAAKSILSAVT